MKKYLSALLALALSVSLASCGDKDSSSDGASSSESSTAATEKPTLSSEDTQKAFALVAGSYTVNGLSKVGGDTPAEYDITLDELREQFENDPLTISEDGVLRYKGQDYQLIAEDYAEENAVFSIEGSGFDLSKYKKKYKVASKDYEGLAAIEYTVAHGTIGEDQDWPMAYLNLYITKSGQEDYCVGITAEADSNQDTVDITLE